MKFSGVLHILCLLEATQFPCCKVTSSHTHTHSQYSAQLTNQQTPRTWRLISWSRNYLHIVDPENLYHIHKSPQLVPLVSQINLVKLLFYFINIHFNIFVPSTPGSSKLSLSLRFSHQTLIHLSSPTYVPHSPPVSLSLFYHPNNKTHLGTIQILKLFITQFSPFLCYFPSATQIFSQAPYSQTPSFYALTSK